MLYLPSFLYKILTTNDQVVSRSVVRPVEKKNHHSQILKKEDEGAFKIMDSVADTIPIDQLNLPTIDPNNLIGYKFMAELNNNPINAEIKELNHEGKYLIQYGGGDHYTLTTYNHLLDMINKRLDKDE